MVTSKVTTRGRIVIPANIRNKFGFKKGTKIVFAELRGKLLIQPLDHTYFLDLAGILGTDGQMLESLVEGKKRERRYEGRMISPAFWVHVPFRMAVI